MKKIQLSNKDYNFVAQIERVNRKKQKKNSVKEIKGSEEIYEKN